MVHLNKKINELRKKSFSILSFEMIFFYFFFFFFFFDHHFKGFRSENEVIIGGNDTRSRFPSFLREKKRLFEFRASKLFRFRLKVFRGSVVRPP